MNGWVYSGAPNTWGQQVAGVEVQKYLAGEADWDEVTKTCIEQWSELRKQTEQLVRVKEGSGIELLSRKFK